jgi:hypothetical protein
MSSVERTTGWEMGKISWRRRIPSRADKDDSGERTQVGDCGTVAAWVGDCSGRDSKCWHSARALGARPVQSGTGPHCARGPAR